ncbi:hemK methyltransferase family member 2-like [Tropilaelaps mercedesae]|uniref:HemK methyltransferase family member 2-like n=1 Tax=Tropilaelaps mercedesae TaxID=418985 RepID=A0A1V9XZY0_9ACAR|nr:hemK methyltransferase family member 2-like [Tropilaelaps mercedesae]
MSLYVARCARAEGRALASAGGVYLRRDSESERGDDSPATAMSGVEVGGERGVDMFFSSSVGAASERSLTPCLSDHSFHLGSSRSSVCLEPCTVPLLYGVRVYVSVCAFFVQGKDRRASGGKPSVNPVQRNGASAFKDEESLLAGTLFRHFVIEACLFFVRVRFYSWVSSVNQSGKVNREEEMAADIVENEEGVKEAQQEPQLPEEKREPPRELLADALRKDASHPVFGKGFSPTLCLELGGAPDGDSLLEQAALTTRPVCFLSRPHASKASSERSSLAVLSDRINCFLPRLLNKVDVLLLSPDSNEQNANILPFVSRLLAPKGRYYLLLSADDKPVELCRQMGKKGLVSREVISKQCGHGETFSVFCFTHKNK